MTDTLLKLLDFLDFINQDVIPFVRNEFPLDVFVQVFVGDDIVPLLLFLVDIDDVTIGFQEQVPQGHQDIALSYAPLAREDDDGFFPEVMLYLRKVLRSL